MMKIRAASAAGTIAWLTCLPGQALAAAEPKVVVTSKPIHSLVAGVMTGVAAPAVLVDGATSPHTYAAKPSDAQKVNSADVVFRVSEGLEPFTGKVFKALPKTVQAVSLAETNGMTLLPKRTGGEFEADSHAGKGHDDGHKHGSKAGAEKGGSDSHVWLDPANAGVMVGRIAEVLGARYPEHAAKFRDNAAALKARIDELATELETGLKPHAGKPFVVLHDGYQYAEKRFGLTAVGAITVSPDVPPSAKRLTELRKKISKLDAVCVFAEPYESGLVRTVAEGTKAKVGALDPEGQGLPAGPDLYFALMRNLAAGFKSCFGATS